MGSLFFLCILRTSFSPLIFAMKSVLYYFVFTLYLLVSQTVYCQKTDSIQFRIMSWNVENLFDTKHDTLKQDYEFLPDTLRRWTNTRYRKKLKDIATTIVSVGEMIPPSLVALCEVENEKVMNDLTKYSPLKKMEYDYVMTNSKDLRGIDVALLYQRAMFNLIESRSIRVGNFEDYPPTRDVLHVSGRVLSGDTLDVFVCHLPSRRLGYKRSERYRTHVAKMIKTYADSIMNIRQMPNIILMGDFNATLTDPCICKALSATPTSKYTTDKDKTLFILQPKEYGSIKIGTYKYRGEWEFIDHIIISGRMLNDKNKVKYVKDSGRLSKLDFLLMPDEKYNGVQMNKTYVGFRYKGGISDHLPVCADFVIHF